MSKIDRRLEGKRTCPQCGAVVDADTHVGDVPATPDAGDRSICLYCSGLNVFVATAYGLTLRKATDPELDEFLSVPEYREVMRKLGSARADGRIPTPETRQP